MHAPRVSLVVNNYNYGRFLRQCIDSALAQDYPQKEVVVVDDASTDDSAEIIRGYADAVVPILKPVNGGQGAAFNAGFAACHGDIVIYLDADDYLYPGAVTRVVQEWQPGLAVVQYRLHLVDEGGKVLDVYPPPEVAFDRGDVTQKLLSAGRYEGTATSAMALGREALSATLPVPELDFRIAADGYLATVAPLFGQVAAIEEPLGVYRRHGDNRFGWGGNLAAHMQRVILHDLLKYRLLAARAATLGLRSTERPGNRDYAHLIARICSLCLDPAQHPVASDSRLGLAVRGVGSCRIAQLSPRHKTILALWFLTAGLLPRRIARHFVRWPFVPKSRPLWVWSMVRRIRGALR